MGTHIDADAGQPKNSGEQRCNTTHTFLGLAVGTIVFWTVYIRGEYRLWTTHQKSVTDGENS